MYAIYFLIWVGVGNPAALSRHEDLAQCEAARTTIAQRRAENYRYPDKYEPGEVDYAKRQMVCYKGVSR